MSAAGFLALVLASTACTGQGGSSVPLEARAASGISAAEVSDVPEDWDVREVAPGLLVYEGEVVSGEQPGWSVSVTAGQDWFRSRAEADGLASELIERGSPAVVTEILWPEVFAQAGQVLGWKVLLEERYPSRSAADAGAGVLAAEGWYPSVEWAGAEPYEDYQQARVALAVIDPAEFGGHAYATYGSGIDSASTVSEMAGEEGALLAVNGGFFVMNEEDGVPGTPAGAGVYGGRLESEATDGRAAVVMEGDGLSPSFVEISTKVTVSVGGLVHQTDGVNRVPGVRRNCVDPDRPTLVPLHDVTCLLDSELVLFTDAFRGSTPETDGTEAVVDATGKVVSLGTPGTRVPSGGYALQGKGEEALWLEEHARVGASFGVDVQVIGADGQELSVGPTTSIVNAGPRLLSGGRVSIDAEASGLVHPHDPRFAYGWVLRDNPRMAIGVDAHDRLLLLGASGRTPGESDGFGIDGIAELIRDLGAVEAVALDGGGSVSMVLDGEPVLVGVPGEGERKVGDAIVVRAG
ncbi:phosphodiester glycosidase family protein [Nocardiopsis quinghaiensis]|uniref:phosphodiester glycosidase family protein n=1 Tax=Nocardiopsis quinghaiensis TaxID=464995 RepID=UPI00123936D8|nr:phosphodiester glycosidase family protein [Nocardiopsis quinghaiensis]